MHSSVIVLIGLLIFEGVNALPASKKYDHKISFMNDKYSNSGRRMIHGKNHRYEDNPQFKSVDKPDKPTEKTMDKSLENVISTIDNGVKTFIASDNKTEIIGNLAKSLVDLVKDNGKKSVFRSKAEEYFKSELIHFRNGPDDKPSVMLELNSQSIINGLKDLLHSKLARQLLDHYSKEAAVVYRSIKYELDKRADKN